MCVRQAGVFGVSGGRQIGPEALQVFETRKRRREVKKRNRGREMKDRQEEKQREELS